MKQLYKKSVSQSNVFIYFTLESAVGIEEEKQWK